MARVTHLFRHPIKGLGAETLLVADLNIDRPLPLDRQWAILQEGQTDTGTWQRRRTFGHVARGPKLAATRVRMTGSTLSVTHPDQPPLAFDPQTEAQHLLNWLAPLWDDEMQPPAALIQSPPMGMTDADYPSVSIMSQSSLTALAEAADQPLSMHRFRGNIWIEGTTPWTENAWTGRTLRIGTAELQVIEPIIRCRAIEANPETGLRDANLTKTLKSHWDHVYFGVNARVTKPGTIRPGDTLEVL
nr:MOSC domain-containing protein [Donghicola mangrovi]